MMKRWPIRVRVAVLAMLAGLLAALSVAGVALLRTNDHAERDLDEFLSRETTEALALISTGGRFESLVDINPSTGPSQRIALMTSDGDVVDATPTLPPIPALTSPGSRYETLIDHETGEPYRTIVVPIEIDGADRVIVLSTPADFVSERVVDTAWSMVPLILLAVAIVGIGSYVVTGLVLRPVDKLRQSAVELARAPGGRRLTLPDAEDEIRSLAVSFNVALDKIDEVMDLHREFVAEASHELRAPLARLSADLEYASRPTRSPEEVAQGLQALGRHTTDMVRVADELLDLLFDGDSPIESIPVRDLVETVLEHLVHRPDLETGFGCSHHHHMIVCDPGQVAGAVRNLVDNGYEHGAEPVSLSISCSDAHLVFVVEDSGDGVAPEIRESVHQPFVRGSRAGRSGLGLAIVSRVAARHGGDLRIDVEPVSRFKLALPIVSI